MLSERENMGSGWDSHHHHQYGHYHQKPSHGQDGDHHLPQENSKPKLSLRLKKNPTTETSSGMNGDKDREMFTVLTGKRNMIDDNDDDHQDQDQVLTASTARICADCKTSKTPLWRSGPDGPKSLCNACGIRYRKRRRRDIEFLKMGNGISMKEKKQGQVTDEERVLLLLKGKFAGKEEAEAALLLMALSCGLCVH